MSNKYYYQVLNQTEKQCKENQILLIGPLEGIRPISNKGYDDVAFVQVLDNEVVASFKGREILELDYRLGETTLV